MKTETVTASTPISQEVKSSSVPFSLQPQIYYACPILMIVGFIMQESLQNPFTLLWISYALIPLLDYLSPQDTKNVVRFQRDKFEQDIAYLGPLYLMVIVDFLAYFYMFFKIFNDEKIGESTILTLLCIVAMAQPGNFNLVVAHELMHRRNLLHKIVGLATLFKCQFTLYYIQHIQGHHKEVGTPLDASTAELNESFLTFFSKSFFKNYSQAWRCQKEIQLKKREQVLSLRNPFILLNIGHVLYLLSVFILLGKKGLFVQLFYSFYIQLMTENSNYIEHYGLVRKQVKGELEPLQAKHAWNGDSLVGNVLMFKLQRHSDHHLNVYKPYQILNSEESPILPFGYLVSLLMSQFPPIWFKITNPLAEAANNKLKVKKEVMDEIHSQIRSVILASFGVLTFIFFLFL